MKKIIYLLIFIYVAFLTYISYLKFISYNYYDFDLAVHAQVLWNIIHGSIDSSILGIGFLGNHAHLILFLITPVYKLFAHPLTLLFLQSLVLGVSAYPLYLLTKDELNEFWGLLVVILYLSYPALGFVNLYEFHPTVFATLFLALTFYYFKKDDFGKFVLFMVLALLCQENIALSIIMFAALAAFLKRGPRWVLVPLISGLAYFYLCVGLIMPYFNKNTIQFLSLYGHLGNSFGTILASILLHPLKILKLIFATNKIIYLFLVFGPLCFIPFLSPGTLILSLPFFLQHLLSQRPTDVSLQFHYLAEIIPFLFIGFIYGIKRFLNLAFLRKYQLIFAISLFSATACFSAYIGPQVGLLFARGMLKKDALDRQRDRLIAMIPKDGPTVATFQFLSHLTERKYLYSFHHAYIGRYTLSKKKYQVPENARYALIDFNDPLTFGSFYKSQDKSVNIRKFLSSDKWAAEDVVNSIVFFKKGGQGNLELYKILTDNPHPKRKVDATVLGDIKFIGYDFKPAQKCGLLNFVFYWQGVKKTDMDINVYLDFIDEDNRLVNRIFSPVCYRIYPTNAWNEGEFIREDKYIMAPDNLSEGFYTIKLGFYDQRTGFALSASSDIKDLFDDKGRIRLLTLNK
ncbi:MAG: DUF2079 domain-containing protein [Candidatus Omnitrophota bacterium]